MQNYLSNLDSKFLRFLREIGREADKKQLPAYVVGGIVRDILLRKKNLDLDITIEGDAIVLARVLAKKWKKQLIVYKQFGTASLETPGGLRVDLATARKEHYAHSGALPTVRSGSLKEDLFRRDFTINAMAIAIHPDGFGLLIDPFGGLTDLSQKKIRVLHAQSFIDDPTRILRAVRFEQRFYFQIESQTFLWMKTALKKNMLKNIKPARYYTELKKILSEADPLRGLKRLRALGGLRGIDPLFPVDVRDLSRLHHRIQTIRRKAFYKQKDYWLIYFMGLVAKSNERTFNRILDKFPFTKTERKSIQQSRNAENIIKKLSIQNLLPSQAYEILQPLTIEFVLYLRVRTSRVIVCRRIDRFLAQDIHVRLHINGEDLKRIGIVSGCKMGRILENILRLKINKRVRTKRDELNAVLLSSEKD